MLTLDQANVFYQSVNTDPDYLSIVPTLFQLGTSAYLGTPDVVSPQNLSPLLSLPNIGIIDKIILPEHGPFTITKP
jgi:hypothetical protein